MGGIKGNLLEIKRLQAGAFFGCVNPAPPVDLWMSEGVGTPSPGRRLRRELC